MHLIKKMKKKGIKQQDIKEMMKKDNIIKPDKDHNSKFEVLKLANVGIEKLKTGKVREL